MTRFFCAALFERSGRSDALRRGLSGSRRSEDEDFGMLSVGPILPIRGQNDLLQTLGKADDWVVR